jgi:transcriptional regulator with XRE-family HTH domain
MEKIFQNRLKLLRNENNLFQKEVAKKLGIARNTYSGYETGVREPDLEMLKKIASIFNCSIDYLIGFSDIKKRKESDDQYLLVIDEAEKNKITASELLEVMKFIKKLQK